MYTLRPYQAEARDAVLQEWAEGRQKTLLTLPQEAEKSNPRCLICGKAVPVDEMSYYQKRRWAQTGRAYCSRTCSKEYCRRISSQTMSNTNRRHSAEISARMKAKNPMKDPECRKRVSQTLKKNRRKPLVHGGNGHGLTKPQECLLKHLSDYDPIAEYVVRTHLKGSKERYPTCYKINIALPQYKIAIEIDGMSHRALDRIAQDKKKDAFLHSDGWTVLRFTNEQILSEADDCLNAIVSVINPALYRP